jgi:hypothetical protein
MELRFTGFKRLVEDDVEFEKSNMDKVLARDLNIVPGDNDKKMDMIAPGGAIEFSGSKLKRLSELLGFKDDTAMKMISVVRRNEYGVQLKDVTGGCDGKLLNKGREGGRFDGKPFPHAPCSPTDGQIWWISAKDWDYIRMPLPPGGGAGGAPPGGPPGPPPGGGAPPPGGGGPPPPPA